ncbi:MAG: VOC family protein [Leptospirales bacterium]
MASSESPRAVHHLAIAARNPARLAKFYEDVLRLRRLNRLDTGSASIWFSLADDGRVRGQHHRGDYESDAMVLMLEQARDESRNDDAAASPFAQKSPGFHLIAFTIRSDRRGAWLDHLERAGIAIEGESEYSIYFRDPEGNRLALSHYPETAAR